MWLIFGITIWLAFAACTVYLYKIDWNLQFPNSGWDWNFLSFIAIISIFVWPISLFALTLVAHDLTKTVKTFFGYIGEWFKDNINWRW